MEGVTPYQWPDGRRREGARELREGTGVLGAGRLGGGGMGRRGAGGAVWGREWRLRTFSSQGRPEAKPGFHLSPVSGLRGQPRGREVRPAALAHFWRRRWGCSWAWFPRGGKISPRLTFLKL